MRTLLLYAAEDENIRELCRKSGAGSITAVEIRDLGGASTVKKWVDGIKGKDTGISGVGVDLNGFDSVILAADSRFGMLSPAMQTFIRHNDFRMKQVSCIVFGEGKLVFRAEDSFRTCLSLSGGTPRNVISVPTRQFKRDEEDMLYYVRHRISV